MFLMPYDLTTTSCVLFGCRQHSVGSTILGISRFTVINLYIMCLPKPAFLQLSSALLTPDAGIALK